MFIELKEAFDAVFIETIVDTYQKFLVWPYPAVLTSFKILW